LTTAVDNENERKAQLTLVRFTTGGIPFVLMKNTGLTCMWFIK